MSNATKPVILSVDDDKDTLLLIERFLKNSGYDVITADRADKALLQLDKTKPDLILTDVVMPEMDGYEFCINLQKKKDFQVVPIIFLTSLEEEQDKAKAFALGAVDYLNKPVNRDRLISTVQKHLKTNKLWNEAGKSAVPADSSKLHPDFRRFKEFLGNRLKLSGDKHEKLNPKGMHQLYSIPHDIGITDVQMAKLIAEFCNQTYVPFIDPENIQLGTLPIPFCRNNKVVAIIDASGKTTFVLTNPFDKELLDMLGMYGGTKQFSISITELGNVELLLKYGSTIPLKQVIVEDTIIIKAIGEEKKEGKTEKSPSEWELERHPVVFIANNIIIRAITEGASDIHIEPKENETVVRFRIDGDMRDIFTVEKKTNAMLISRYKILAGMDIAEKRKPQDGAFEAIIGSRNFKLRAATTSTPYGESLIMRLLEPTAKPRDLKMLGMTNRQVDTMIGFANRHQGFILIVGATGSGKTTTIYSLLSHIDCRTRSLITVEDPVEYKIPFANQQQVNVKGGVTFEALLKSAVRQDPDILYMGEMRDPESAKIAVDFASTGHMAISTMHTSNATTAIFRLERLGINRVIMAEALLGIVAQRLLKKLCPYCKKIDQISPEETDMLAPFIDEIPSQVAHPVGCPQCNNTGYSGREGIYEVIEFDSEVAEMVRSDTPIHEIRNFVRKRGIYLMSDHAVAKVKNLIFPPQNVYEKILVEEKGLKEKKSSEGISTALSADKKTAEKTSILVVEDDKDTQKLLALILGNQGYEVTIANDGIDALLHLGKKEFAMILSDIDMPNLDGLKLLELKNQKGIKTPVIFLTAHSGNEVELKGFELGATDYIRKPIQKEVLLLRIKKALKG